MIIVSWAQRSEGVEQGLLPETNRTDRETNFWPGRSLSIDRRKLRRATRVTRREMPTVGKMSIRHGLEDARLSSSLGFRSFFTWFFASVGRVEERNVAVFGFVSLLYENKALTWRGWSSCTRQTVQQNRCYRSTASRLDISSASKKRELVGAVITRPGKLQSQNACSNRWTMIRMIERDATKFYKSLLVHNKWETRWPRKVRSR